MKVGILVGLIVLSAIAIPASNSVPGKLPPVPASANRLKNPYAGKRSAAIAGSALYRSNCSMCHGDEARGRGLAINLRTGVTHSATDGSLFWFITYGNLEKGMPPFARLTDDERWQIVSYLKSLSIATERK